MNKEANQIVRVAKDLVGFEFDTLEEMNKYLKDHPRADRSNHWVKSQPSKSPTQPETPVTQPSKAPDTVTGPEYKMPEEAHGMSMKNVIRRNVEKDKDGKPVVSWTQNGKNVEDEFLKHRLESLKGTKAWSAGYQQSFVSSDPSAVQLAWVVDSKQRVSRVYSEEHNSNKAKVKFAKTRELTKDIGFILKNADEDAKKGNTEANLLRLEDLTSFRIGSTKDTKADVQAYGLTTLKGEHVSVDGNKIHFNFTAKEGETADRTIEDADLAKWITERKNKYGNERLFPDTSDKQVNKYLASVCPDDTHYTVKDFRTFHGTSAALEVITRYRGKTLGEKERKAAISEACKAAADLLGNTPAVAKSSYIDPTVWNLIGGI